MFKFGKKFHIEVQVIGAPIDAEPLVFEVVGEFVDELGDFFADPNGVLRVRSGTRTYRFPRSAVACVVDYTETDRSTGQVQLCQDTDGYLHLRDPETQLACKVNEAAPGASFESNAKDLISGEYGLADFAVSGVWPGDHLLHVATYRAKAGTRLVFESQRGQVDTPLLNVRGEGYIGRGIVAELIDRHGAENHRDVARITEPAGNPTY